MSALTETGFAKLNLALHVRGRRPDGRHDIETMFAFCEDGDQLSAEPSEAVSLEVDGPFAADLTASDNLVARAAETLRREARMADGVSLRLDKRLPVAAGIGGGSADAAAALRLLTRHWALDPAIAARLAPGLGSDVPACLRSRTSRGSGAGDELTTIRAPQLARTPVLLVNPRLPLSTSEAFARWDGIDRGPLGEWQEGRNDLEPAATALVPAIAEILDWLRKREGAAFVRMSGSGATCFALFHSAGARDAAAAAVPGDWWHLATKLR